MATYKITHTPSFWECRIAIDENATMPVGKEETISLQEGIKQMVEFWVGWKEQLKEYKGDYRLLFFKNLAKEILYTQISGNYNTSGVISTFNDKEGWCPMDGSAGIKILSVDDFEFDRDDLIVEEIK